MAHRDAGRGPEAVAALREAVTLHRALLDGDPANTTRPGYRPEGTGVAHRDAGRGPEAMAALREAVTLHRALLEGDPPKATYQRGLAIGLENLGVADRDAGRGPEAVAALSEAVTCTGPCWRATRPAPPTNGPRRHAWQELERASGI